jgi:16S rRNA (guanine527-N7)-methyltransferase
MLASDVKNFLSQGIGRMGLSLDNQPEALTRLCLYFAELKKWNSKVNLVSRSLDDQQTLENHFLDSLTLLELLPREAQVLETILDVGTGAGFPGMVLKAVCPALSVTLMEPRKNRFFFLKHIARVLQLKGVEILNARLEEKGKVKELADRKFSFITSRAFTDTLKFISLTGPYLKKEGRIVLMKGPGVVHELDEPVKGEMDENFFVSEVKKIYLPFSRRESLLVSIRRTKEKSQ